MQRFAAGINVFEEVTEACDATEAFAHCTTVAGARDFQIALDHQLPETRRSRLATRHVAGSALLDEPKARFDAVRPGLAMYRGAARVTTRLVEVRESLGPIGYTGWTSTTGRHGVILAGYSNGLRPGVCAINGEMRSIREVGMQSAFVEAGPNDKPGDEVVLLDDDLAPAERTAKLWGCSPQEVLVRLCGMGTRRYV
jgi:alanine racemase